MTLTARWVESEQVVDGAVYRIRLNRPEQMNALTPRLYGELRAGVMAAIGHPDVRAVVIEGDARAFAAGGDLKVFLDLLALPPDERMVAFNDSFDLPLPFQTILDCPKPVIAKIDGYCLAGGTIIAAAADIAICTDRAVFGIPEGRVGLADPFAATLLPAAIGLGRARYLMLTGRRIDAATALDWGLVAEVVAPEQLDSAVDSVVEDVLRLSPESVRGYKRASVAPLPRMNPMEIMQAALSENGTEGLAAFSGKRPPVWQPSIYPV